MIGKLTGTLTDKHPPEVIIDCHGVGYEVQVPMSTFYNLPAVGEKVALLTQFIRGIDNTRANLSRLCVDTARHILTEGSTSPALPSDIVEAKHLIPGASLQWLTEQLPGLDEEQVSHIVAQAEGRLDPAHR